jgi:hypothetical protein
VRACHRPAFVDRRNAVQSCHWPHVRLIHTFLRQLC